VTFSSVQKRDLTLVAILRGVSYLGDAIALIALYLRLAQGAHASWAIASLSIAAALPLVLLSPISGFIVDHTPAKRLLTILCFCEGVVCLGIGLWHGRIVTIGLMALLSCFVAFSLPGYSALVPTIAGEDNLTAANSTMQSVQGIAAVAGPGLGGLLVGLLGQSWPLYFDAISFGLGALGTWLLVTDRRPDPGVVRPKKGERDLGAGMRILFRDGVLRPLVITFVVFLLSLVMINVAEVFFITKTLHSSALMYGLVGTSFGVGNVVGAVASSKLKQHDVSLAKASLIGLLVISVMTGLIGLVEHVGYLFVILVILGTAVGVLNVAVMTLMTVRTPEAQRGQMFAASSAAVTSAENGHRCGRTDSHHRCSAHGLSHRRRRDHDRRADLRSRRLARLAVRKTLNWKLREPDAPTSNPSSTTDRRCDRAVGLHDVARTRIDSV
jgi:MFS family permease